MTNGNALFLCLLAQRVAMIEDSMWPHRNFLVFVTYKLFRCYSDAIQMIVGNRNRKECAGRPNRVCVLSDVFTRLSTKTSFSSAISRKNKNFRKNSDKIRVQIKKTRLRLRKNQGRPEVISVPWPIAAEQFREAIQVLKDSRQVVSVNVV